MAHILFVHRHGPGQFLHLAPYLAEQGHDVAMLCERHERRLPKVELIEHRPAGANAAGETSVDYQTRLGARAAEAMEHFGRRRDAPDLIFGHAGWGSLLHARDVFPAASLVAYCEHYYRPKGADIGFDPAQRVGREDVKRLQTRNFAQVTTLLSADAGVSPTRWQKAGYPDALRQKIGVIHEGIDTEFCRPDADGRFTLPDGQVLRAGDRVVTYASRHLEPYRGFPQFMRAAAQLARKDRLVTFVVAGADGTAYGADPGNGRTWREVMVEETGIDPSRIHFVGTLSHERLIQLFQVSAAHVYLTYPFVLSWSMLEAMAAGVHLIGSDTAPVTEFVEHGRNGHLVPFFDVEALVAALGEVLEARPSARLIRRNARDTVMRQLGRAACLRRQSDLIGELLGAPKIWK